MPGDRDIVELALQDDRNRIKEKEVAMDAVLNGPSLAENRVSHPWQYDEVEPGDERKLVFNIEVPGDKALVVKQVANEWYPETVFHLDIDGNENDHQRTLSDPEEPLDTTWLVEEYVEWRVTNNSDEDRDIGILTDGFYVPHEVYKNIKSSYEVLGGGLDNSELLTR